MKVDLHNPISIFLVDDNAMYMVALKNHIESKFKEGIIVRMFTRGEDCLKNIQDHPNLVILDYFLNAGDPDAMHGLQIMKKIQDSSPDVTIIMLSAQNSEEIAASAIKYGAKEYIVKSAGAYSQIETVIKHILYRKESEEEWVDDKWNSLAGSHI